MPQLCRNCAENGCESETVLHRGITPAHRNSSVPVLRATAFGMLHRARLFASRLNYWQSERVATLPRDLHGGGVGAGLPREGDLRAIALRRGTLLKEFPPSRKKGRASRESGQRQKGKSP